VEPDYLPEFRGLCFSAVFIPHEVFTPQKYVHSSTRGSAEGGTPSTGFGGPIPLVGGFRGKQAPDGGSGVKPSKEKFPCKNIL
jgi:hypothetical protein